MECSFESPQLEEARFDFECKLKVILFCAKLHLLMLQRSSCRDQWFVHRRIG